MTTVVVDNGKSLAYIPVEQIRESVEGLRSTDRENVQYQSLVDSVRNNGVISPISVRQMLDSETGETFYSLIDGCQRYNAAKDVGHPTIPAQIMPSSDFDVLLQQIIANTAIVETEPAAHSRQLLKILQLNPTMTISELAASCSRTPEWLQARLKLVKLTPEAAKLVDTNVVNLSNAYCLARLPADEQASYLEAARSQQHGEFSNTVKARLDEIAKAKRSGGTSDKATEFVHKPYLLKVGDIVEESKSGKVGDATITELRITSPEEAWKQALLWASTSDAKSVAAAKEKWDKAEVARLEKKQKAAADRARRKVALGDIKQRRNTLEMTLAEKHATPEEVEAALKAFDEDPANKIAPAETEATA